MTFADLGLNATILNVLQKENYNQPTPIQAQTIPHALAGKDVLGIAQTGTGKTAAFSLPIIQKLQERGPSKGYRHISALILTPTRELAQQIYDNIEVYAKGSTIKQDVIFGGVSQVNQTLSLKNGTDILIATPGRLLDLMNQGYIYLDYIEFFVLDEADRMLDMGFINDVRKLIKIIPSERQTLFFSATMPDQIAKLADSMLYKPVRVEVTPASSTAERIEQHMYFVPKHEKHNLLVKILSEKTKERTLIFTRTKHGADKITKALKLSNINASAIHGDKSQASRQSALQNFKMGKLKVLVATDIASRGIDVTDLETVINFDLPDAPESYVHRIGRTGRAGSSGLALSFCDRKLEMDQLKSIQKLIGKQIPVRDHEFAGNVSHEDTENNQSGRPQQRPRQNNSRPPRPRPASASGQQNQQQGGQPSRPSRNHNSLRRIDRPRGLQQPSTEQTASLGK